VLDPRSDSYWQGPDYCPMPEATAAEDAQYFEDCFDKAIIYITKVFSDRNTIPVRRIFFHTICATDQHNSNIQKLFWDVKNITIRSNLRRGGLMV
jgi:hypothetical protein